MIRPVAWLLVCVVLVGTAGAAPVEKPAPKINDDDYELFKVLVDTMDQVERHYVEKVDRRELIQAAIQGVMEKLDPYSSYITPEEIERFRSTVEGEFGGVGVQVAVDDGQLTVVSPLVGTPGYRAGLMAGDRIVEIDGKSAEGINVDAAVGRLKGPEGSVVTLTIIHRGQRDRQTVKLTRERIHVATVLGDRRKADDRWDFMLDTPGKIAYIRLSAFSRETARELREALDDVRQQKLRGLILDLRFNPGGLLGSAVDVCDLFIARGRIVSTQGRSSPERVWEAHEANTFEGFPMVVLVNHYSASASEIVAACLQDHKRAIVIGERTWGKGSVQNVIELDSGHSALKLTTAGYRRPSGKNIHRSEQAGENDDWGVVPDPGFEIKLGDAETLALAEERRRRDIIEPKPREKAAEASKPLVESTVGSKPSADAPAAEKSPKAGSAQPPVDRQLQAALVYLSGEMAKAE